MSLSAPFKVDPPSTPYAIAFVDGQNLYRCALTAFEHTYPNYDCKALAAAICKIHGWTLTQVRFYTGIPAKDRDLKWHEFWARKVTRMTRAKILVETRPLAYATELLEDGRTVYVAREKGIDVKIAIDIMRLGYAKAFDVALVFSQDQDLAEVANELRDIARKQSRWIKMMSAFPVGPATKNRRGINGSDWFHIDRTLYDSCLDEIF